MTDTLTVSVLGTGIMGAAMARNLLRAGHTVRVWNRSTAKAAPLAGDGAQVAATPAEAVRDADVILTMLYDGDAVRAVLHDAAPAAKPGAIWVQSTTTGIDEVAGLAALAGEQHVLVTLGDQPRVGSAVVARMAAEPAGSRAAYHGVPGHPAVLGPEQFCAATASLRGDRGLRGLRWRLVECGDLGDGRDVDTPDDLEEIRGEAGAVLRR